MSIENARGGGPIYDRTLRKNHDYYVPFNYLPIEQKAKDFLFRAVVHELRKL